MVIKSRKSSKIAKLIIALTVLLPALFLVSLYPRMEKLMLEKRAEYENAASENTTIVDTGDGLTVNVVVSEAGVDTAAGNSFLVAPTEGITGNPSLTYNFVNYATEASYYLYSRLLQEAEGREVNTDVLDNYGWINDFYNVAEETEYYAQYETAAGDIHMESNSTYSLDMLLQGQGMPMDTPEMMDLSSNVRGYLIIGFDPYGKISKLVFESFGSLEYRVNLYETARQSVQQFDNNVSYYLEQAKFNGADMSWANKAWEVVPKNFQAVFAIPWDSAFVDDGTIFYESNVHRYHISTESIYWDMGVIVVIVILAVLVALVALILPFIKKLNTGWEKLFCIPFELVCVLCVAGVIAAWFMFELMCYSTMGEVARNWNNAAILGYTVSNEAIYGLMLVANFVGWAICFLAEYTVVSSVRQFLSHPIEYLKNRLLGIMFIRWIWRQCKRFVHFMTDIDISEKMHSSIVKIVLLNFLLVAGMCCGWFVGIGAAVVYSVVLYLILRKKGKTIQNQYNSIVHAAEQMAEGELRITLQEDLGMFAPLGRELEQVQEGFSKAVAQEAKSQNMKTELISNVSHDLKTPLTAMITYIGLLKQEGNTPEQQKSYIQTLDMKSQRLKVLIEDLFEVSKAQSGNIQLNMMDVDVVSLMKQLRLEMEDKIADSDLTFRWNLPEDKVILTLDGQKTYRIFENLLTNALKYAMPQSRVYVDVLPSEEGVEIVFKNISATEIAADADSLTERFVRGDASRNSEGSGLGLAIVKSFTEIQGGTFKIDVDGDLFKAVLVWKRQMVLE